MATIQEVYIALFGRPADPIGYNYYVEATDDGANLDAVGDLSSSPEYLDRFDGMSNIQKINAIYQDLFGRDADAAGLTFYVGLLNSGAATEQSIAIQILDGATGDDATIIENKVAAAQLFTDSLDDGEEISNYDGAAAAAAGRAYLDGVGLDEDSIPTQEEVDAAIAALDGVGNIGDTITLTEDAGEQIVGTGADDTVNAIVGGADATLNTFDDVQGGEGTDTFNAIVGANIDFPASSSVSGFEIINLDQSAFAISNLNTDSFEGAEQVWEIGGISDINVGAGVTVGFRDTVLGADIIANDGVASINVALDNVTAAGTVEFFETTAGDLTSVTVSGEVAGNGDVTVDTGTNTTAVDTINLGLTADGIVTLTTDVDVVTTVDASASTGDLVIDASAITALESLAGGEGSDTLSIDSAALTAEALEVDAGAGNDVINVASAAAAADDVTVSLTGGEGNDTFAFSALANVVDEGDFAASLITITDFNADEDVLDVSMLAAYDLLNNTEAADVADEASLEDAIDVAASYSAGFTAFDYDGNLYLLADAGAALANGDGLVEITGASVADLDGSNFLTA